MAVAACLSGGIVVEGPTVVVLTGRNVALDALRTILTSKTHLFDNDRLREIISDALPVERIEDLEVPFECVAASVERASAHYFDRGPIDAEELILGGYWSTYWYGGRIYGTEIARGLDVLALVPSEHLSENEIAAAALADQGGVFNPQQQLRVRWPAEPVVARAYMDQLARDDALDTETISDLSLSLDSAEERLSTGTGDKKLAGTLERLSRTLGGATDAPIIAKRRAGLANTLEGIAARLR